nr:Ig-like domain-containing protein [Lachnospiraceae bacterium]
FEGCTSLPAVRFPATLESIGTGAFKGSLMGGGTQTSYGDVVIPASVGHIGYDAFRGCGHLETVTFENYEGAGVPAEIEFGYHYTNHVLTGEGDTFSECPNLICVTLSNKTQTLPGYFAANDANLVHLIAPYAVTGIGTKAFYVENECGIVLTTESDSVRNYNWESDHRLVSSSAAAVRLEEESITIRKGETRTLTATVITVPEDAAKPGLVWKSDDNYETYVKVDQSGRVTGVRACPYELTVTATAAGNGGSASCKVKVTDSSEEQKVTGVKLNRNELTLGIGKTYLLTATVTPADAADKAVSWTSDKESVARVDSLGRVTGVSEGQATITVITHDGEKKDTCVVTVREGAPDPTPTPTPTDSASGLSPEATMTEDGKVFLVKGQTHVIGEGWAINGNTKIITLKRGVITAKKADSQPVTLTKDGEICKVYVSLPSVKVGGKKSARLTLGGSAQVTLGGIPGAYLSYYPVSWVSSNPAVISLDTPVNGMITARAVGRGSAKVTAYVGGKPYRVTLTVANAGAVIPKKIASEATIVMDPMQSVVLKYSSFKPKNATWSSADDPLRDTAVNARSVVTAKGNGVVQVKLSNGKLTAVGEGETTLVGENGGRRVTLHIQVRALPSNPLVYLKTGASKKLTAPRLKANAAAWETVSGSDANVLTSWEKGQVKATSVLPEGAEGGHAQVRCSWKPVESGNGFTYYYDVFVENPSLREDASAGFAKGTKTGQYTLSLTEGQSFSLKEHYGNISQDVFWTSSNATIAYVDEYGTVHANTIGKTGNAVLQARVDGVLLKVTVTVSKAP